MKNIIAYSMEKLYKDLEEADELFLSSGMKDMELYEKQLAEAARKAAAEATKAACAFMCAGIRQPFGYSVPIKKYRIFHSTGPPTALIFPAKPIIIKNKQGAVVVS